MTKPHTEDNIPAWFAWIADRGVVFWRVFLLLVAGGFLTLAYFIHGRLKQIEQNLGYHPPGANSHVEIVGMPDVITKGQTVFVPAYSHVYHQDGKPFPLTTTLSIHNTDRDEPIVVTSADYYGTSGKLVRQYVEQPKRVGPLGSIEFLIAEQDTEGGSGAKFVVNWVAEKEIHEPVIQTVMVGTSGGQGLSYVCDGIVLEDLVEK
jgi:hypothetical protein